MKRRGASSEALKIGVAILLGFVIFAMLSGFAVGPVDTDKEVEKIGRGLLNYTQNDSLEILEYE